MSEELKPCPHCGGEVYFGYYNAYSCDSSFDAICCDECCTYMKVEFESREEVAEQWNTRHLTPKQQCADEMHSELSGEVDFLIELLNKLIPGSAIADEVSGRIKTIEDVFIEARGDHDNN